MTLRPEVHASCPMPRTWLPHRPPMPMLDQQRRTVDDAGRLQRLRFVLNLDSAICDRVVAVKAGAWIERVERARLDRFDHFRWARLDAHGVPRFGELHADGERVSADGSDTDDVGS